MSHYLIAGGAGFIGSHLTETLLQDDHRVTVLDDFSTGTTDNFFHSDIGGWQFQYEEHDITTPLPKFSQTDFDVVINLASIPTPGEYMNQPIQTLRTGAVGTRQLLDCARKHDATFLLASTSEVYGDPQEHPQTESYNGDVDPYGPRACYDESKRYGEALVRAYRDEYDLDVRIARIFNTYGPRMRDGRVIPTFIRQALAGEPLAIHGDGSQTRSFCYIDDLVNGLRALFESDITEPVNLGNPDEVKIGELADIVRDIIGQDADAVYTERPPDDPERRQPDITKAKNHLNWNPEISLCDGLHQTVDWMRGANYAGP